MSLVSRETTDLRPQSAITTDEMRAIDLYCAKKQIQIQNNSANDYIRTIAKLGGFLGRKSDGNPGPLVLWRGYLRLQDIMFGVSLAPS